MALISLPRALLSLCLSVLAIQRVSAQNVAPTNNTANDNNVTVFVLDTILGGMETKANINPLTPQAGLSGSVDQLEAINPKGPLVLTTTQNAIALKDGDIAYISCEPSDYAGGYVDASKTVNLAASRQPDAIVLYSIYSAQCTFSASNGYTYPWLYTMLGANQSDTVVTGLNKNNPSDPTTSINVNQNSINGGTGSGNTNGAGGNVLGKSPTTAVAMIILYSITGIITALFLMIIVVGAIRAHRHPERYGPRRVMGRPRQSRAKGIARAMLETLPIVKFGDQEENKPTGETGLEAGRDVELAEHPQGTTASETTEAGDHATTSNTEEPSTEGPDTVTTEAHAGATGSKEHVADTVDRTDQGLACSVCVEDFEKGQDLRVLPCKHKFHPECIDPWLLNVSGTCPLCRVDLQPTASHDPDTGSEEGFRSAPLATDATLEAWPQPETPTAESAPRNRRSRILHTLNHGRMRQATPEERLAALRWLRRENQTSESVAEQGSRPGSRFSRRLSHALGGSRPASRPLSEVGPSPTAATFSASGETASPRAATPSHGAATPSSTVGTYSRRISRAFGGSRPTSRPLSPIRPEGPVETSATTADTEDPHTTEMTQNTRTASPAPQIIADTAAAETSSHAPEITSSTTGTEPAAANSPPSGPPRTSWYNSWYRYRS